MDGSTNPQTGEQRIRNFNINFGPQHPAAHGVLRMVLELDGEIVERTDPHIGLLHRGTEKLMESRTYLQNLPYFDRLDYVAPMNQEHAFALGVEKLLGIEVPPRAQYIRVLYCEIGRLLNHLLNIATFALDVGAMTPVFYAFESREKIFDIIEQVTGGRMHPSWFRIGGLPMDLPDGWKDTVDIFTRDFDKRIDEFDKMLTDGPIFRARTEGIGVTTLDEAIDQVMAIAEAGRSVRSDILVICHGGPLDEPENVGEALARMPGIDGFFGASSIERLPTERAITGQVEDFKGLKLAAD